MVWEDVICLGTVYTSLVTGTVVLHAFASKSRTRVICGGHPETVPRFHEIYYQDRENWGLDTARSLGTGMPENTSFE